MKFFGLVLGLILSFSAQSQVYTGSPTEGKRLGEVLQLPHNGTVFTAIDGSVWKATNSRPLAYTGFYAGLLTDAPTLVTAAIPLGSPFFNNDWQTYYFKEIVGSSTGGATWLVTSNNAPAAGTLDFFYTSTNAGVTWTQRTPPAAAKQWVTLWDGVNFVAYPFATANAYESTDGINWTSRVAVSLGTINDIFFANNLYIVIAASSTSAASSADRTTWTARTLAGIPPNPAGGTRMGTISWNAGAGLWLIPITSSAQYQTSPDFITWTARNLPTNNPALNSGGFVRFASNATTTIMMAGSGVYASSTDGINWTGTGMVDTNLEPYGLTPFGFYYDGTRFVVNIAGITYYSANGTTWTRNNRATTGISAAPHRAPSGVVINNINTALYGIKMILPDVTSTATNYISGWQPSADNATLRFYVRIH